MPTQPTHRLVAAALAAILVSLTPGIAIGQQGSAKADAGPGAPAPGADLAAEIADLRRRVTAAPESSDLGEALGRELSLLERLETLDLQQDSLRDQQAGLERAAAAMEEKLVAGAASGIADTPPYPLALVDVLSDALEDQERQRQVLEDAVATAEQVVARSQRVLAEAETARRKKAEDAEREEGAQERARSAQKLRSAELQARVAQERLAVAKLELDAARGNLELNRKSEAIVRSTLTWVENRVEITDDVEQAALAAIDREELALRQARESASLDLERAQLRLVAAEKRLDAEAEPSPQQLAEVEALQAEHTTIQQRVAILLQREERQEKQREVQELRFRSLAGDASRPQMRAWAEELAPLEHELGSRREVEQERAAQARAAFESLRERRDALGPADPQARWLTEHARSLEERSRLHSTEVESLDAARALVARSVSEMERRTEGMTLGDRLEIASDGASAIWDAELAAVDDRPITIGKVVTALGFLVAGFLLASFLSRLLGRLLRRRELEEGASAAFQSLAYYGLVVLFFLFALRTANIPLTAFTILGGAFAIGLGFGSQTLVSNFIAGLILLVERPIKVSDMIEVDQTLGRVESIGLRSTRVRTFDNIHIIVPNSAFLEQNVVNWNLSDDIVRANITVGVAYGSPTREVERLLLHAAEEHGRILSDPPPAVLFTHFGDNALEFICYFWLRARNLLDRRRIESDMRHQVDHLFREAGITIAFPQRDVHLDASTPIPVTLQDQREDGSPPAT